MANVATIWQTAAGGETSLVLNLASLNMAPVAIGSESGVRVVSEDAGLISAATSVSVSNTLITATLRAGAAMAAGERYRAEYETLGGTVDAASPSGGTLLAVSDIARTMVTIDTFAELAISGKTDPYAAKWAMWANLTVDDIVSDLVTNGGLLPTTTVAIPVSGAAAYDLSAYGMLRIDGVQIGTPSALWPLPIFDHDQAFAWVSDPTLAGAPFAAWRNGLSSIGLFPLPTDTTQSVYVTGPALPTAMTLIVGSGLPPLFNECIAAGMAKRACNFDRFNPERVAALPYCDAEYRRLLTNLRDVVSQFVGVTPGFRVADDAWGGSRLRGPLMFNRRGRRF